MPLSKTVPTNRWGWNGTPRNIWYVCQSITNLIKSLCYKICIYKLQNIAEFHNFVIMILLLILWLFLTDRLLWLTYSPCSDQIRPYIKHNEIHNQKQIPRSLLWSASRGPSYLIGASSGYSASSLRRRSSIRCACRPWWVPRLRGITGVYILQNTMGD